MNASAQKQNAADAYYRKMTETPIPKLIFTLGIPTTVSMLITNIYNMADTYFVGALGESQQAATGILFTLQAIIQAIAFMLGQGSGSLVAKALADKNTDEASGYVSSAILIGSALDSCLPLEDCYSLIHSCCFSEAPTPFFLLPVITECGYFSPRL